MAALQSLVAYCLGAIAAVILTLALAGASFAQQPAPASRIAAENAEISAQMANARTALDGASAELAQLRKATSNLDERMHQIDRRGVAVRHFGWDETSLSFAARTLRRFAGLFVPLVIIAAPNLVDHAPFTNRESLGRMLFSVSMLAGAAFLLHLLRRKSPLMQRLFVGAPRSWAASLHGLWLGALVAMPLAMAGLAAAGYFVVAAPASG